MVNKQFSNTGGVPELWAKINGDYLLVFQSTTQVSIQGGQDVAVVKWWLLCKFDGEHWGYKLVGWCPDELFHGCNYPWSVWLLLEVKLTFDYFYILWPLSRAFHWLSMYWLCNVLLGVASLGLALFSEVEIQVDLDWCETLVVCIAF